jgi:glycine betaine catabolism B
MIKMIDGFLNGITMYRLLLYGLFVLLAVSYILSLFNLLPFTVIDLTANLITLLTVCYVTNKLFAKVFKVDTNYESFLITALILELILSQKNDLNTLLVSAFAGAMAISSKYLLAINKKHIFNPAGFSLVVLGLLGIGNAFWWVGSFILLPFVAILSLLIIRKLRRFHMVWPFLVAAFITSFFFNVYNNIPPLRGVALMLGSGPLVFLVGIMLTEPLTTPGVKKLRMVYGALTGLLFGSQYSVGPFYSSPELALILGNIFSYIVSSKQKLFLNLKEHVKISPDTYDFIFENRQSFNFLPGQYLEWTLGHDRVDSRGTRRYFTIASSPTEKDIRLGVKIDPSSSSSFKIKLMSLKQNAPIVASQLSGDFVLPKETNKKLVFIAGGIGITPFRSVLKYLTDKNEKRDIVLIYTASDEDQFVYKDVFAEAVAKLDVTVILFNTKKEGHMTSDRLVKEIPDFKDRTFYISGSHGVVVSFENLLKELRVSRNQIVTDYFPGY